MSNAALTTSSFIESNKLSMPHLYLIRHPRTHVDPARQPHEWGLSELGRGQVIKLNEAPFWKNVTTLYSSNQPKAIEAAQIIGKTHEIEVIALPGLAEVWRGTEVYLSAAEYDNVLGRFFSLPNFSIEGWERATNALARFSETIKYLIDQHPGKSVAILSHGTILTLYTAMLDHQNPTLERWREIGFATVAAVEIASMLLVSSFISAPYENIPMDMDTSETAH